MFEVTIHDGEGNPMEEFSHQNLDQLRLLASRLKRISLGTDPTYPDAKEGWHLSVYFVPLKEL